MYIVLYDLVEGLTKVLGALFRLVPDHGKEEPGLCDDPAVVAGGVAQAAALVRPLVVRVVINLLQTPLVGPKRVRKDRVALQ